MDTALVVAIITATVGVITFYLTKQKEREAVWRGQKLEHYKALLAAMNGIVGEPAPPENKERFAYAANNVMLVGSPTVLVTLRAFLDEIAEPNREHFERSRHNELLTALMYAIRDDVGIKPNRAPPEFRFRLWASGRRPSR